MRFLPPSGYGGAFHRAAAEPKRFGGQGRLDCRRRHRGRLDRNWLGKVEFRYADFGNYSHKFFVNTFDEADATVHARTCTVLAGIGYKFNGTVR